MENKKGKKETSNLEKRKKKNQDSKFIYVWTSITILTVLFFLAITIISSVNLDLKEETPNNTDSKIETGKEKPIEEEKENGEEDKEDISKSPPVETPKEQNDTPPELIVKEVVVEDNITYSIPEGHVALTFDDGPSKYTVQIADILKQHGAGATFFFIGYNVNKYPDIVHYVYNNGLSVGSHSMNHKRMAKISDNKQREEILESMKLMEEIIKKKVDLFRPPYGSYNEQTKQIITNNQSKMILWNKDPKDWKTKNPDKILQYIHNNDYSGSVIIMHESQAIVDTLPRIIEHLKKQNLEIVNLK